MPKFAVRLSLIAALILSGSASAQDDLAGLIPANSVIVVYIPSWGALESRVLSMAEAFGQKGMAAEALGEMKGNMGPLVEMLDQKMPLAICVPAPEDMNTEPEVLMILPMSDPAAAAEQGMPMFGKYACVSPNGGEYAKPETASRLAATIPAGDLVVRLDMSVIWGVVSQALDQGLGDMIAESMAEGFAEGLGGAPIPIDPDEMVAKVMKMTTDFLSSSDTLDLVLGGAGGQLDIDATLILKAGSPMMKGRDLPKSLVQKAKMLPSGHPLQMLVSADFAGYGLMALQMVEGMASEAPPEMAEGITAMFGHAKKMYAAMGNDMAFSLGMGKSGLDMMGIMDLKDPAAYCSAMKEGFALLGTMGLPEGQAPKMSLAESKVGEADVMTMSMQLPEEGPGVEEAQQAMTMLFGKEGFRMSMATLANTMVMTAGGADRMGMALGMVSKAGATPNPVMAKILGKAGSTPGFLLAADLKGILAPIAQMARSMGEESAPDLANAPSVPVGVYGGPDVKGYRTGLTIDVGAMAKLVKLMN